ncbi:hypothetical protein [Capnocytophaga bilenii]
MRLFSYIFLFLLTTWQLIAQTYPVQVVPVLTSPYSSKIADYANPMANRVQLQVITTDLSVQNRPVQLYVEIKGNGLSAASAPVLSGVSPLRINGGEILRLTNAELASYFQFRNLQGITSQQYDSALPDGMYSFCFRVKDVLSGRWLSQSHCAIAYLMLNDPPILNIPTDNEQVAVTDFQNIIFSWTPRQINATNVTYSFELREILDPTLDPRFAFEVSRLILKEDDLRMTTFVYDVSKPNLISGRRYAWRVRAISTGGLAENSVFKNNGYSEVHSFVYAVNCNKPLFLLSQQQGKNRTKLLWQGHTLHQKYHIQYRKKGVANAQWFEASTRNTQTLITDLEAGEYEFRVGATCETERYGIKPSYVYSDIQTFEIEKTQSTTESAYNCGIVPKIAITTKKPLGSLVANEVFVAGDFSVTILEVSGSNGIFSGKGFIKVPYLNDTKLAVEFENIKINADYQLTDGIVKTTYDSDWKGVQFLENTMAQGKKSKDIKVSFEVEKVETRNDEIVVIGKDGRKEVFPFGGNDSSVKGKVTTTANGVTTTQEKIYHIDKEGKVSSPQAVAQGGKPTKENTNGVTENGEATALTAKGIEVRFENTADSKYAYEVPTKAYSKDYQKMGGKYLPFKAVVKGEAEPFLAKVHISDKNIIADSLIFKTDKGALIESKRIEGSDDFLLTLKGFYSFAVEQVQATIKQGKKYQIAGVFNLVHLSPKTAKVVLVPTTENLSIDTDRVKAIYNKIGVTLDITWAAPFDITPYLSNGVLETKDVFGDLTDYSLSQQKIINAYKATGKVANDTYYVFITNAKSSTGQGGYMALGGQFGFIFDQNARTLAHELGHGIFKLAHPFKKKQQGDVPSLMDYTSDEDLLFADWKQINDPAFKIGIFQVQSEGEYNANAHLGLTPDGIVFDAFFLNNEKINTTIEVAPDKYTIQKISYQGYQYYWDRQSKAFVGIQGAIKVKREAKNINNKVNIYRSRKDGCTYDYLTIPWETKDEQSTNIVQTIEKYIAQYNESYWRIAPYTVRDASCGKEFFTHLRERDLQECSTAEINEGRKILQGLLAEANPERVTSIVNSYCMSAISGLTYGQIEKLFDIIASQERITEHSEVALLRLMSGIKTTDYKRFYAHLEANGNKLLKHLIEEIDDASVNFLTDKKNYTNFIGALVWMFNHNPASIEDRWGKNEEDFAKRTLNLNPIGYSEYSSFMYSSSTSKKNEGEYVSATGNIKLYDVYTIKSPKTVLVKGDVPIDVVEQKEPITEVSPLTPLIIVPDKDKLPLMKTALEGNDLGNEVYIVPAIFLKYGNDKIRNDYIEKGVITTLDVATIALSGGTALATKVHWVRRAWALAEVVGAVGDIGVNVSQHIDPHSSLGQVVNSYNLAMGVIGIKNLGQAGYKFAKNLPQATKELLQKNGNLRVQLAKRYQDWKKGIEKLKTLNKEERDLLDKQEEVWRSLGFVDDFKKLIYRNVSYEDFIKTFNATDEQYKIAFKLWGEEKWDELYKFFKENGINEGNGVVWPPYSGFSKVNKTIPANKYTLRIDRFQKETSLGGGFGSPILRNGEGIESLAYTYDSRMLSDKLDDGVYYFSFKMSDKATDVQLKIGDVAPWFSKSQNLAGEQIEFSQKLHKLDANYFNSIEVQVRINGEWRKCVIEGKSVVTEIQDVLNKLPKNIADDIVDFINIEESRLLYFKNAQKTGKLDRAIEAYKIYKKNKQKVILCP